MDKTDAHLVTDIALAAYEAALQSLMLKIDLLPLQHRTPALAITLQLFAVKADTMARVMPSISELGKTLASTLAGADEANLRSLMAASGFGSDR